MNTHKHTAEEKKHFRNQPLTYRILHDPMAILGDAQFADPEDHLQTQGT
jgi:hypothetical protein